MVRPREASPNAPLGHPPPRGEASPAGKTPSPPTFAERSQRVAGDSCGSTSTSSCSTVPGPQRCEIRNSSRRSHAFADQGISEPGAFPQRPTRAAALEMPGVDCVEVGLSICDRDTAPPLIAAAATRDVAVIARQPFGSGALLRRIQGAGRSDAPGPSSAVSEESILSTCLHYPLSIDGVSAVYCPGMSKASHVVQSSTLLQAPPPSLADLDPISAYVCAGARRAD